MAVYKENSTNTWRVIYRFVDWTGEKKQTSKRGFETKRDAQAWEREQLKKRSAAMDMLFSDFVELYFADMKNRIRLNTWNTKEAMIRTKLLPYFSSKRMNEIVAKDVIAWQNKIIEQGYSQTYLKSIHNQLSAIFNHAIKFYDLTTNPAAKAGHMGKKETVNEMLFWTKEEYLKFADSMMDKPLSFYAFEILYWCGLRLGELLALTPKDFDFEKKIISITKSYQRISSEDIITDPKTPKSKRIIQMSDFLNEEIKEYTSTLYGITPTDRMFPISKSYLHHEMDRGSKEQGIKRIRIHDLRHSHVSLLIEMGFSAVAIANRVGHESIDITYRYAHMFPTVQAEIANKLDLERG